MCCPSSTMPQRTSFLCRSNLIQVCPSCRAFFRRSVQSGYNDSFKCTQGRGNCEVTLVTRKNCQYCRCHLLQDPSSLGLLSHRLTSGTRAAWLLGCAQAGSCLRRNARAGSRPYFLKLHQIFRKNVPGRTGERQGRAAQPPHMQFRPL